MLTSVAVAGCATFTGCANRKATIQDGRRAFLAGDLTAANTAFQEIVDARGRYARPAELDLAMVELARGDVASASSRLRNLRDQFDQTSQVSKISGTGNSAAKAVALVGDAASMLTDDTMRVYQAAGYEEVMIRTMLAMCSLVQDDGDAESYMNQAAMHQAKLRSLSIAKHQQFFPDSLDAQPHQELALAPYLRGVLREATHHDFDDAQRNYQLVSAIKPDFLPALDDLERATSGTHSRRDHGALYVFAMVGRGPVLETVESPVTTAAVSIASALLFKDGDKEDEVIRLPKITSVKVPTVVVPPSPIAAITIVSQQDPPTQHVHLSQRTSPVPPAFQPDPLPLHETKLLGATQSLTNVAELFQRQADAELPWTIARAFARQVTKEFAVTQARESLGLDGGLGTAFQFAASTAWTASEEADTRCWGLLPREVQVLRAELPVGQHRIMMAPVGNDGYSIGPQIETSVTMHNGRNTYLVVIAPTQVIHLVR